MHGPAPRFAVAVTTIVRDEAPYLPEWIEYHTLIGVEHFYLYDNGSRDDLHAVLAPYIVQGRVTLLIWPEYPGQVSAYNHAVKVFGRDVGWMAIIDVDEFIQMMDGEPLPAFLERVAAEADQVLLPWMFFGASGHEEKPPGLVTESYVHRAVERHRQPKAIVRPGAVALAHEHNCTTVTGRTIDPAGRPQPERWILPTPAEGPVRLNHYFTKSRAEFLAKLARGQSDGGRGKTPADFDRVPTPVEDRSMLAWAPAIRAAVAETAARPTPHGHAPFSAQSELSASRAWLLAAARAVEECGGEPADRRPDRVLSNVAIGGEEAVSAMAQRLAAALDARSLAGFALKRDATCTIETDAIGRVYAAIALGRGAGVLTIAVEGLDAGGKPHGEQVELAVGPDGLAGFVMLAARTLRPRRITARWTGETEPCGTLRAASFI